jgi:hypothetical protein
MQISQGRLEYLGLRGAPTAALILFGSSYLLARSIAALSASQLSGMRRPQRRGSAGGALMDSCGCCEGVDVIDLSVQATANRRDR